MDEDENEDLNYNGSDVEVDDYNYTDTEESPYATYQSTTEKFFNTNHQCWQKFSFITTLIIVSISITVCVIALPIYVENVSISSNTYAGFLFISLFSTIFIGILYFIVNRISPQPELIPNSMKINISKCSLFKISCFYALTGILVALSLDENRVLCHLQDPIKGITLVFSLVYYFFFSQKMMSLQRIFSSTTIIVGLFISVDYGLCDEFRCRGRELSPHSLTAKESWGIRAIWTLIYIGALAFFALFFTLLECHFTTGQQNVCRLLSSQNSFLYTVSRLVSSRDIRRRNSEEEGGRLLHVTDPDPTVKQKQYPKPLILKTLFYIHLITFLIILGFCWINSIPGFSRGLTFNDLYNTIEHGFKCHFKSGNSCYNVAKYGWIFIFTYVIYAIATLNFLSMSESAVFTVAANTISLPLSGIWWSIYKVDVGLNGGTINWSPGVTGELICALLGLPVVLLGLGLLVRSHFRDIQQSYQYIPPPTLQSNVQNEVCHR